MLNFLSFYHAGKSKESSLIIIFLFKILGQEIYKEFDYYIRFLHQRVLKV